MTFVLSVSIKWLDGATRRYFFDIQTSNSFTGPWTTVFSGASQGVTDEFEEYDFKTQNARYIRVTGHGNSIDNTMQIVDIDVDLKDRFAMVKSKSNAGNHVAQNTLDGNLNTRWAGEGDGQWIQYDLLKPKMINAVSLAWHGGNTTVSSFDIMTSNHPMGPWTTVYSGSSSGTTLQLEEYEFTPVTGRFIRIKGHGNSQDSWNNITEVFINTGPAYCGDGSGTFLNSDYNRDCRVDILDLAELTANWLTPFSMSDFAVMGARNSELLIMPGQTETLLWKPQYAGIIPFYCSDFCSALHQEMQGYIRVSPRNSNPELKWSVGTDE